LRAEAMNATTSGSADGKCNGLNRHASVVVSVPTCFLLAQATLHTGCDFALDVKAQFVVNIALQTRAAKEVDKTGPATPPASHFRLTSV
jgi:hypothetical protein